MIVSHRHRFIFLKTRKTAGTSVEIALAEHLGRDDVITRIGAADEAIRQQRGFPGPQHDLLPPRRYRPADLATVWRTHRPVRAYNHMSARETRDWVGKDVWDEYRKVTIVRNPFDAVVSHYFWKTRAQPEDQRPTLAEFIRGHRVEPLVRNWLTYTLRDVVVADHVCRYETLDADLAAMAAAVGLPGPLTLPHAKALVRADRRHPRDLLTASDVVIVRARFARELETFGYDL